VVLAKFDVAF